MFMSANLHEPSADMTGAVAKARAEEQHLSDVRECNTSMNHLLTLTSAL
jgi:hypothetical protein